MNPNRQSRWIAVATVAAFVLCASGRVVWAQPTGKDQPKPKQPPAERPQEKSKDKPAPPPAPSAETKLAAKPTAGGEAKIEGDKLILPGVTFTIPAGWTSQPVETPGPPAPKAVLKIPNDKGDPGIVHITHNPDRKGEKEGPDAFERARRRRGDEVAITRLLGQVLQAEGKVISQEQRKIENIEANGVKMTVVDQTGTVSLPMRDELSKQRDYRMVAAIVDDPQGPHLVVAAGPKDLMTKSRDQVLAFLKSVRAQ